jgi:hypothetical protein
MRPFVKAAKPIAAQPQEVFNEMLIFYYAANYFARVYWNKSNAASVLICIRMNGHRHETHRWSVKRHVKRLAALRPDEEEWLVASE